MDLSVFKVAIIDDDAIHLDIITSRLRSIGVVDFKTFMDVDLLIQGFEETKFDILISDFFLDNNLTYSDLFNRSLYISVTPTVIVSSFYDESILTQILKVKPLQFLPKNASGFDFKKAILTAIAEHAERSISLEGAPYLTSMFVKSGSKLKKIVIDEIQYISVSSNYLDIQLESIRVAIRSTLNDFLRKLPNWFLKANQSDVVNLKYIKEIDLKNNYVVLHNLTNIPLSRSFKKIFVERFQYK